MEKWNQIQESKEQQGSLVQWDRVARPGLFQQGDEAAEFEYATIRYN